MRLCDDEGRLRDVAVIVSMIADACWLKVEIAEKLRLETLLSIKLEET